MSNHKKTIEEKELKGEGGEPKDYSRQTLGELLKSIREAAGVTQEEFALKTKIPLHHVKTLEADDLDKLPPNVYVRGIIRKYAVEFGLKESDFLVLSEGLPRQAISGPQDILPQNRFAVSLKIKLPRLNFRWQPLGILLILAAFYLILEARALFFAPKIILENPAENSTLNTSSVILSGRVTGARKVVINGREVTLEKRGNFSFDLSLVEGLNSIEVTAKNLLGKEAKIVRYLVYQLLPTLSPSPPPQTFPQVLPLTTTTIF